MEIPEASEIGWTVAILVPCMGALLYIIRAEIRKNGVGIDTMNAEMQNNHGTSLRDAIDRLEQGQQRNEEHLLRIESKHDQHIIWHATGRD
jgi:hypothetical protein